MPSTRFSSSFSFTSSSALFLAAVGIALVGGACAGGSSASRGTEAGEGVGAGSGADGDAASGRYSQGVYSCCAEGEGRTCCSPETLPDPKVGRTATCFQYGGVRGACVAQGNTLEAKDICSTCCPGLTRIESSERVDGGTCEPTAPPSVFVCAACGDGVCGAGENACNCPGDCP